jgi:hypothetical protein
MTARGLGSAVTARRSVVPQPSKHDAAADRLGIATHAMNLDAAATAQSRRAGAHPEFVLRRMAQASR